MNWKAAAVSCLATMLIGGAMCGRALAWGQEGHAVIAEIAQHRLSQNAYDMIEQLLRSHLKLSAGCRHRLARIQPGPA